MNEGKLDVQPIGDCRHPFGPASVGAHNDCVPWGGKVKISGLILTSLFPPPPIDVLLDPLEDGGLSVQVVHRDVEEALDLARVKVHCDYMVRPCHLE